MPGSTSLLTSWWREWRRVAAGGFIMQLRANARLLKVLDARAADLVDMAAVCSKLDPELLPRLVKRARDLAEELRGERRGRRRKGEGLP